MNFKSSMTNQAKYVNKKNYVCLAIELIIRIYIKKNWRKKNPYRENFFFLHFALSTSFPQSSDIILNKPDSFYRIFIEQNKIEMNMNLNKL